jgi:RNA polymerase-associated protein CTR9
MGHKAHAKAAWERSAELVGYLRSPSRFLVKFIFFQYPSEWTTQLLLGLESINASKSATATDEERASLFLSGTRMLERAFKANNKNAAAANALCEVFLLQNKHQQARASCL